MDHPQKVFIIGIVNVTPDSFSEEGEFFDPEIALEHALHLQDQGADFIDIGAESTRPMAKEISEKEQIRRLSPLLSKLVSKLKIPISLDTRHATVARFGIDHGVAMINDVSGLQFDPKMISLIAATNVSLVLMHSCFSGEIQNFIADVHRPHQYKNLVGDIKDFFLQQIQKLESVGVDRKRVILDPGIGFSKKGDQNLEILAGLSQFQSMGFPLLIGLSRKSFLESYFGPTQHPKERGTGTEVAHMLALLGGANFLRVHDVVAAKKTLRFFEDYRDFKK